jgi:N12 class adenine-specific DNA methylase
MRNQSLMGSRLQVSKCANQIDELCSAVEKTIEQAVQNCLNNLEKDAQKLKEKLKLRLREDEEARNRNFKKKIQSLFITDIER